MNDLIRILLLLGIAGAAMTLVGSGAAWWLAEDRRLTRLIRRVLGGTPDAQIIAKGRNAAVAVRLDPAQVLVLRQGGAKALLYGLGHLVGAELDVDGTVVARAYRGEPRKALDQVATEARQVTLRLIFDDPRNPDFELELWAKGDELRRDASTPAAEIREARRWLSRVEAILRRQPEGSAALPPRTEHPGAGQRNATPDLAEPPEDDDFDQPQTPNRSIEQDEDPNDPPWTR
jgi:hypothetical protein